MDGKEGKEGKERSSLYRTIVGQTTDASTDASKDASKNRPHLHQLRNGGLHTWNG